MLLLRPHTGHTSHKGVRRGPSAAHRSWLSNTWSLRKEKPVHGSLRRARDVASRSETRGLARRDTQWTGLDVCDVGHCIPIEGSAWSVAAAATGNVAVASHLQVPKSCFDVAIVPLRCRFRQVEGAQAHLS